MNKNKHRSKNHSNDPIKKCSKITAKLLRSAYKSRFTAFKLDDDPLQCRVYLLSLINSIKTVLSLFKETYMLIMDYPYIRRNYFLDYAKNTTWEMFHAYINAQSKRIIDEYPVDVVQTI